RRQFLGTWLIFFHARFRLAHRMRFSRHPLLALLLLISSASAQQPEPAAQPPAPPAAEEVAASPATPGAEAQSAPQPEPITPEQQEIIEAYVDASSAWSDTLIQMKTTAIRYANEEDRSPEAKQRYYDARDKAREQMNATFAQAVRLFKARKGDFDAASMMTTTLEYRESHSIYENSLEAAELLLESEVNYPFLYLIAARSAFLEGQFDRMMEHYEAFVKVNGPEKLERVDNMLIGMREIYAPLRTQELALIEAETKADDLPRVRLETTRGPVVLELFENQAPNTVANFIQLVESGFYDGTEFYQVVDDFVAMGGDPVGDGSGTSGRFVPDEYQHPDARKFFRGYLSMAKVPDPNDKSQYVPNSASSQFAIALMPLFRENETQTVFGRVLEGMEVVCTFRRIDPTEKKEKSVQLPPDRILTATVVRKRDHEYKVDYAN
ncbi:MAG: peptidylprolyl isomerase, partial [Planctomycetaceae bacterium]